MPKSEAKKESQELLHDDAVVNEFLVHMKTDPKSLPSGQHERIKLDLWRIINMRQTWVAHYYKVSLVVGMIG